MSDRIFNREWARTKLSSMTSKGGNVKLSDMGNADGVDDDADDDEALVKQSSKHSSSNNAEAIEEEEADEEPEEMASEYVPTGDAGVAASAEPNSEALLEAPPAELQPQKGFSLLNFFRQKK
jgi:hypothetical protein